MTSAKHTTYTAILCNYNHAQYLPQTIATLVNQTVKFDEILIIDDASTDDSVDVLRRLTADVPYARIVVNETNLGVTKAYNKGLAEAKSEFIFYVSADDHYSDQIVEWADKAIALDPTIAFIAGNMRTRHIATGEEEVFVLPFKHELAIYQPQDLSAVLQKGRMSFFGSNILRRGLVSKEGGIRPPLEWSSDWFLYFALAIRHSFAVIPHEVMCVSVSDQQYSARMQQWRFQRPVIMALMEMLQTSDADLYPFFRHHALLPTYDFQALWLFLTRYRAFVTPLLLWRLTVYKPLRFVARKLIPRRLFSSARRLFKI